MLDQLGTAASAHQVHVTSVFPFHQLRQVLAGRSLGTEDTQPVDDEGEAWRAILGSLRTAPVIEGEGDFDAGAPICGGLEAALDMHQALDVCFVAHRVALMAVDLEEARRWWGVFARRLRHHLATEDRLVNPAYAASCPDEGYARGAAPAIVDNEHRKIEAKLDALEAQLHAIRRDQTGVELRCLRLLDRQKVLQDILEHHDLRERRFVYPHLAKVWPLAEQRRVVAALMDWPA